MNPIRMASIFFTLLFLFSAISYEKTEAATLEKDLQTLAGGNNAFALQLYAKLSKREGNLFCSPYSIFSALATIYAGSEGYTKSQMERALHFGLAGERLHSSFRRMGEELLSKPRQKGYELTLGNAVWVARGQPIRKEYREVVKRDYQATVKELDFKRDIESARRSINSWAAKQSRGKFTNLIGEGVLTSRTRLVLTNAIYFNGTWESGFDKDKTAALPFTLLSGEKIRVPMMRQAAMFSYLESEDFKALGVPYKGSAFSMIILLPGKHDGLTKLEESVTPENLEKWLGQMTRKQVYVELPKFKIGSRINLSEDLKSMGLSDAFSAPSADFSGINGKKDLFVDALIHEALVEVTERGAEAGAATSGVIAEATSISSAEFKADHPFLFLIRGARPSSVIFLGRLAHPAQ